MYDVDTAQRINRAHVRALTAGRPYPLFRGSEVDDLFRDFPFGIPSVNADGSECPDWYRSPTTIEVRNQLEVEQAKERLRAWVDDNEQRLVGIAIIAATPGSFTLGVFYRHQTLPKRTPLNNKEFLDGEDPRQPIYRSCCVPECGGYCRAA